MKLTKEIVGLLTKEMLETTCPICHCSDCLNPIDTTYNSMRCSICSAELRTYRTADDEFFLVCCIDKYFNNRSYKVNEIEKFLSDIGDNWNLPCMESLQYFRRIDTSFCERKFVPEFNYWTRGQIGYDVLKNQKGLIDNSRSYHLVLAKKLGRNIKEGN